MTRISRIELFHVAVPLASTFYPSWIPGFPQTENRFDLLRVITDSGVEGWAAGPSMGKERAGLGGLIAPYLIGEDATDLPSIRQRLREMSYLGWRNWWMEPAFWDIVGKVEGKPIYKLLDPACDVPERVRVYASTGEVKGPRARIAEVEARLADGFDTVKLRVHDFDERVDIAQVTETAAAVGDRVKLGVDANQAWRVAAIADAPLWDLARAKRFADACADANIAWIEEPLPMDGYADLTALTAYSKVPIAGGELHTSALPELRYMIEQRCYDIFQPDAVFAGGIWQTYEVIKLCRQHQLTYTPHTWTNGFGFAVNLQLHIASGFAAQKQLEFPYNPPSWTVEGRDGVLAKPFAHKRGEIDVPTGPGLGIDIDKRALRRYGKRFFSMGKAKLIYFALRDRGLKVAREIDSVRRSRRGD